jgi:hypothetical protein
MIAEWYRDEECQIRNISVYSFSSSKYNNIAKKILKNE